ncbi:shikimate dehydrogenase family protein [Segetibacter aerophilus]|uniref:Shikimate 5-dehydrogenase n=1 Tax=Segetibacter aerophilus TaxID=670293 RepID=A0A512BB26_9BACT|nr:shikimate dehydrogenase [Segetibacter aerophilus]GEO09162.1 shikimate 5-dehydrogenase [Segetibacter aerophilus]
MRKFGLIGFPLSHSFSPAFFAEKFSKEGIVGCSYEAYPIDSIDKFPQLLSDKPNLEGINVTIPYKKAVIPFLHQQTEPVRKVGACNCIKIRDGKLTGYNTDVIGFKKSLSPKLLKIHKKALILGTGGSAAAVAYVLEELGINYYFVSRKNNEEKNSVSYKELTKEIVEESKLIINTTPLGMYPQVDSCPDIPYQFLTTDHYLFDLVYNPGETLFLKKGASMGAAIKNGADMLIIQAEESWNIWNEN